MKYDKAFSISPSIHTKLLIIYLSEFLTFLNEIVAPLF